MLKTKIQSDRSGATTTPVLSNSIFIDRIGSGDTALVQFKTSSNVSCALAYYSQNPNITPTQAQPTQVPCSNPSQPRQTFAEKITGLRTDTLYFVNIYTWVPPATQSASQYLTVRETTDFPSLVNGDPTATFTDLTVARLDIPLMSAEVFHNVVNPQLDAATIKSQLTMPLGCQQGMPTAPQPFRTSDPNIRIQNLSTRDFAAASATVHPDYPERLQLAYSTENSGLNLWTMLYQFNGTDVRIPVQPVNQIVNLEMESTNITTFDPAQVTSTPETFPIDATKPLQFSWVVSNTLLDPSYMTVQLGSPDSANAVYCVFKANSGSGSIPASYLQSLDDGVQIVFAELVTNQLWVKDGWLFNINDWRSGRISK